MDKSKTSNLSSQIGSGLIWNFMERGGAQTITLVVQLILARLLTAEDYGILGILNVFISLSSTFVNNGLGNAVIQKKNSDEKDFNTVFHFQLWCSILFVGVLFLIAPGVESYYLISDLALYLRIMSMSLLLDAMYTMQMVKLKVTMQFKKRFWANTAGVVVQSVVGIALAWKGYGVWSLIVSQISHKLVLMLVLMFTVRWFPKLQFSFVRLKQLFGYSWKLFVGWMIGSLHQDIYVFVIGKFFSVETLGYYNRGSNLPQTITRILNETTSNVMFPALAKVQDDAEAFKLNMRRMMSLLCFLIWPVTAGLAAISESFVMLVLTEKWAASIPMMQLFAVAYGFNVISTTNMQAFNAIGRSDVFMKLEIIKRTLSIGLLLIAAFWLRNIYAVIGVIVLMGLFSVCYNAIVNNKMLGYSYREQVSDMIPPAVLAAVMYAVTYSLNYLPVGYLFKLILQIATGIGVYFALARIFRIAAMENAWRMAKTFVKRR